VTGGGALALPGTRGTFPVPGHEGTPGGAETPGLSRCYLSRMPRDIDVGGSLALREADDAVIVVTKQAATAPRLFRRYAPNVLLWTV